ncbi:MAG: hypothetical protein ACXWI8_22935, partial [Burkholderiales bacterium]
MSTDPMPLHGSSPPQLICVNNASEKSLSNGKDENGKHWIFSCRGTGHETSKNSYSVGTDTARRYGQRFCGGRQ